MGPRASTDNAAEGQSAGDYELITLRALSGRFPDVDSAMAEIARLAAVLTLPKGTVHVISDIHGEDKKLRHVINNASGTLRPLIQKLFAERMSAGEFQEFQVLRVLRELPERERRARLRTRERQAVCAGAWGRPPAARSGRPLPPAGRVRRPAPRPPPPAR